VPIIAGDNGTDNRNGSKFEDNRVIGVMQDARAQLRTKSDELRTTKSALDDALLKIASRGLGNSPVLC
jgi:hypothetical protein